MQHLAFFLRSMLVFSMLFLFINKDLTAQKIPIQRSHAIAEGQPLSSSKTLNATGTLNVVAIMVEFQPDSNRLTSGTGIFGHNGMDGLPYLKNHDIKIEPLPHDKNYFEAHLEFAKNYYEKSSGGRLTLNYQVLPQVFRLPEKMEFYSPTGETFTNEKLARLTKDAWQKVNESGSSINTAGLDPETTAFVIFHAGVGRDIELVGTSLDITPLDIPSLYLRKDNLARLLENPAFNGFSVNNGSFRVTNSMIIPRTQSRRGLDIQDNEFVFPLSINGLLIASIGSHLGLPDLFNTETGNSGIGRFGLMDGAGFFAYNGLIPPEPSAWEKIYLGWETPFEITTSTSGEIPLPAGSLNQPNAIAKYKLSESEYFLIENRHRDPDETGITLTIRKPDSSKVQQTFTNQDEAFVFQEEDFDSLFVAAGTLVDASNFDFSLPGGLSSDEDENDPAADQLLNGGILIWHIDEAMINHQLANDRVNADPNRRGVNLKEADGAQDIGKPVPGALDNSAAFGSPFDFWWSGNDYRVILQSGQKRKFYENRFGPDTRPNNSSNSGAPSFFELYDFSDNQKVATFKIRPTESNSSYYTSNYSVSLNSGHSYFTENDPYYSFYPLSLSVYETAADTFLVIPSPEGVTAVSVSDPTQQFELSDKPAQQPFIGDELVLAEKPSENSATISLASVFWNDTASRFDTSWTATVSKNTGFISSQDGQTLHADLTTTSISAADGSALPNQQQPLQRSEIINGEYSEATINNGLAEVMFSSLPSDVFHPESAQNRLYTGNILLGNRNLFYVFEDHRFLLFDPEADNPQTIMFEETAAEWPAVLDDAAILHIDKANNQITATNKIGGMEQHYPIPAPKGTQFIGTPLYADLITPQTGYAVIAIGQDSLSQNIYAYAEDGSLVEGFPLYVGEAVSKLTQPIHPIIYDGKLFAVSHAGDLKSWTLLQVSDIVWGSRYGNAAFNKISAKVDGSSEVNQPEFGILNGSETYNWPNPANDFTNIRFELAPPGGTVQITVITTSGRIIFEKSTTSPGGFPQEIQIETGSWGSGGYIARVKATVDGKTETKLIKIGVLH